MTRSNIHTISSPGTLLPHPIEVGPSPWPGVAIAMMSLGLGLAWYAWARGGLVEGLDQADARVLAQASQSFEASLKLQQRTLEAQARVLVDDARIRTTLATPGIDTNTVEDVLKDLHGVSGQALYAVLDTRGVVRAVVGADSLRGVDLGKTSLAKRAQAAPSASDVWALQDRALVLAIAPVRLGDEVSAYFVVGDLIGAESLGGGAGIAAALVAATGVVAGTDDPLLVSAASLSPGTAQRVPDSSPPRVARTLALGEGTAGAVATWMIERHHGRAALGGAGALWMPLTVIGLGAVAASALALRAARLRT